jgi:serine/threonine-protein kinase
MLRVAAEPIDAYQYLVAHAAESTRVGTYSLEKVSNASVTIRYKARGEAEVDQASHRLCQARRAELRGLVTIWGLPEAEVESRRCLAEGDDECSYSVRWATPVGKYAGFSAIVGAAFAGGGAALSGSLALTLAGAGVGASLGLLASVLLRRAERETCARALQRNRIAALERGLEVRGQFRDGSGGLSGSLLGGKYRILHRIGSGGIGAVYAAEHVALGSRVAVKVLRGAAAIDAAEIARLRREAQVQVSIEHPNVVRTLDLDQMPDGSIYVVMELLRGVSLAERLRKHGPLPQEFATQVFVQVCRALAATHRLGVVHRDLKPGNIFLGDDGSVKVLDFGMSKFAEAEALTQDGYTLGTPEYMSPEQCIGAPVEPRTDLYALGVMMYEALTGELPILGRSRRELLDLHQRHIPTPMRVCRPDLTIGVKLDAAVMSCLSKRAAERPASASDLEQLLTATASPAAVPEYPAKSSRPERRTVRS